MENFWGYMEHFWGWSLKEEPLVLTINGRSRQLTRSLTTKEHWRSFILQTQGVSWCLSYFSRLSVSEASFCGGKENGNYQAPTTCQAYIACSYGVTSHVQCPGGKKFDTVRRMCVEADRASCSVVCPKSFFFQLNKLTERKGKTQRSIPILSLSRKAFTRCSYQLSAAEWNY